MKSSIISILSIFLLLQLTTALPFVKRETGDVAVAHTSETVDKAKSSSESSEEDLGPPRNHLIVATVIELAMLAKYAIDEGGDLLNSTIKELRTLPDQSEALQANITRMEKFVNDCKAVDLNATEDSMTKVFETMHQFGVIINDYENMPENSKLKEQLKQALNKSGYEKFQNVFKKQIDEFIKDFIEGFNGFLGMISESEKEKDAKLIEWFNKFKAEKDIEKQFDTFEGFFEALDN